MSARLLLAIVVLLVPTFIPLAAQEEETPPPPVDVSPLQQRDTPPGDVLAQMTFGGDLRGGLGCLFAPSFGSLGGGGCVFEVAEDETLDFAGFTPGEVISVEVVRPDGTVDHAEVVANGEGYAHVPWTTLPGEPLGEHAFSASQGALEASGVFTVRAATGPRSVVLPRAAPPGTTFQAVMAGFPPDTSVPLWLYQDVHNTFWYRAALPPARVNERGEAIYDLPTRPDDPEGQFLVVTEPRATGRTEGVDQPAEVIGKLLVTRGGDPSIPDVNQWADLVEAAVETASRMWAAVLGDSDRPVSDLEQVFADARLAEASAEVESLRASGQSRTARLTAPLVVRSAQEDNFRIDAVVTETWEDLIFDADGSRARDLSGPVDRHYVLDLRSYPCFCWLVVESAPVGP